MWAIEQEHPAAAALLIAHGADVNAQSKVVSATGRLPGGLDGAPLFAAAPSELRRRARARLRARPRRARLGWPARRPRRRCRIPTMTTPWRVGRGRGDDATRLCRALGQPGVDSDPD